MNWKNLLRIAPLVFGLSVTPFLLAGPQDRPARSGQKEAAKVVDPVCGMTVDPKTSEKSEYKGKTYYFCSRSEKEAFDKTPEKYIAKSPKK